MTIIALKDNLNITSIMKRPILSKDYNFQRMCKKKRFDNFERKDEER